MPPIKSFQPGDPVIVTYNDEQYQGKIISRATYPLGAWRVWRKDKHQLPSGWGLESGRVETVDPRFISRVDDLHVTRA